MIKKAAIGLRAHSGWAALVALAGPANSPEVIARRRIEIADPGIRGSKQPYHAAEPMEFSDAKAYLDRCVESTRRLAGEALQAAMDGLRDRRAEASGCGIILGSGRALPGLESILKSHALIHTAEGEFFRNALVEACGHCGLAVLGVKEKELFERGSAHFHTTVAELQRSVQEMGKPLGPPWTQDQKYAALAAWMALEK
ncbi:MAG TPA: hypothetical protein VGP62_01720 [Bryobacteraceae bacterium]|jgi:hypothetical protein|nr:hypothetical protein [Bryobacteraceae bacterium]